MQNTIGNIDIENIITNVGHPVASGKKNSSLQTVCIINLGKIKEFKRKKKNKRELVQMPND